VQLTPRLRSILVLRPIPSHESVWVWRSTLVRRPIPSHESIWVLRSILVLRPIPSHESTWVMQSTLVRPSTPPRQPTSARQSTQAAQEPRPDRVAGDRSRTVWSVWVGLRGLLPWSIWARSPSRQRPRQSHSGVGAAVVVLARLGGHPVAIGQTRRACRYRMFRLLHARSSRDVVGTGRGCLLEFWWRVLATLPCAAGSC